jgi:hypothetical protein
LQTPGLLPFAVLSNTDSKNDTLQEVATVIDDITDKRMQSNLAASAFILAGVVLEKEVIQRLLRRDLMRESVTYQLLVDEGRAEGVEEGIRLVAVNMLKEGPARKVGVQVSARVRRVTNNRFSLTLVQTDAVEGRWRSRQVTVALYDPQTNTPITDVRGAILSSTSPHPSGREISLRLTVTTTNPPTNAYLIVKDADDESELLRENWAVSLGIANDFGDF